MGQSSNSGGQRSRSPFGMLGLGFEIAVPVARQRLEQRGHLGVTALCGMAFLGICAAFGMLYGNWWPLTLGPFVLLWISAYGFLKRFTALCHVYLGSSLALSPIAAAIAINPQMIVPGSNYWNMGFGLEKGDVEKDEEAQGTMRTLGQNMAWLLKRIE